MKWVLLLAVMLAVPVTGAQSLRMECLMTITLALDIFQAAQDATPEQAFLIAGQISVYQANIHDALENAILSSPTKVDAKEILQLSLMLHLLDQMIIFTMDQNRDNAVVVLALLQKLKEIYL